MLGVMFLIRGMDLHCLMIKVKVLSLEFKALQIWQYLSCLILPHLLRSTLGFRRHGAPPFCTHIPHFLTSSLYMYNIFCLKFFSGLSTTFTNIFRENCLFGPHISTEKERQGGEFHQPLPECKSRGTFLPFSLYFTGKS